MTGLNRIRRIPQERNDTLPTNDVEIHASTRRHLLKGAGWTAAGQIVARGSILLSGIVVARILTQDEFGKYGLLRSMALVLAGIAAVGMGAITTRSIASHARSDPERAGRLAALTLIFSTATGLLAGLGMTIASAWLAETQLNDADLAPAVIVVGVTTMLAVQQGTLSGMFVGLQRIRELSLIQIVIGVTLLPLVAIGAYLGSVLGALSGFTVYQVGLVVVLHIRIRPLLADAGVVMRWSHCLREWRVIPSQAMPLAIAALTVTPAILIAQSIVAASDQGFAQVAIFSVAFTWGTLVTIPPSFVWTPMLPMIAENRTNRRHLRSVLLQGGAMQLLSATATALVVSALAWPIMASHGPEYTAGVSVLVVVAIAYVVTFVAGAADIAIQGAGNLWLGLAINMIWAITLVGCATIWGPKYGAMGLAFGLLVAYAVKSVLQMGYLVRFIRKTAPDPSSDESGQTKYPDRLAEMTESDAWGDR